jgi:MFS family permease
VVGPPFLSENSSPEHRDRFFAAYFAVGLAMGAIAPIISAAVASWIAGFIGQPSGAVPYRLLVLLMAGLSAAALVVFGTLRETRTPRGDASETGAAPGGLLPGRSTRHAFALVLLMSGLVALGAGQLIPFLNVFVQRRFDLDLLALNVIFAVSSLGTLLATLAQPWLASRLGRVRAIVALQLASLPFIVVLGWGTWLPLVVLALVVRNTLMNAGNPLFQRFAMDQVPSAERARLSGSMQVLWSGAWVAGGIFYGTLQGTLGFDGGYAVAFTVTIGLYALASLILFRGFRRQDRRPGHEVVEAEPLVSSEAAEPTRVV